MRKGIYKEKNGSFKICTKIKVDDKFITFTKRGYATKNEADADFERAKQQFIKEHKQHCEVLFFKDLVEEYKVYRRRRVRIQTARIDDSILEKYCKEFYTKLLQDVFNIDIVENWFNNLVDNVNVSAARKNKVITVFLALSEFAYSSEYIDLEIYQKITRKVYTIKVEREKTDKFAWTKEEMIQFFNSIDSNDKWYVYFKVLLYLGCRIGEMNGLQWHNVDFNNSTITIDHQILEATGTGHFEVAKPKNKLGVRSVYLTEEIRELLEEYKSTCNYNKPDDYLFFGSRPISKNSVRREQDKITERAGIRRGTPHTFRHTMATWLIANCVDLADLKAVADRQGDSLSVLTDTYIHSTVNKEKSLISAISLKEKSSEKVIKS